MSRWRARVSEDPGSFGPGRGGGCPNPAHGSGGGTPAGEPVDPITGRVTTVAGVDLALPGAIPLAVSRSGNRGSPGPR